MQTLKINSSAIREATYDPETQILTVVYPNGKSNSHYGVPPEIIAEFEGAESQGKFYNAHIKGKYESDRSREYEAQQPPPPQAEPAQPTAPAIQGFVPPEEIDW